MQMYPGPPMRQVQPVPVPPPPKAPVARLGADQRFVLRAKYGAFLKCWHKMHGFIGNLIFHYIYIYIYKTKNGWINRFIPDNHVKHI